MAKPSEFYVGVIDLFAIVLPGAIATAILEPRLGAFVFGGLVSAPSSEAAKWAVFLAVSYFLGHLIFLAGSYVDVLYNLIRERLNPYGNESAYQCATRVRDALIDDAERKALNTFQWSRSVLLTRCPAAAEDVHRLEADSKFFRSLLIVSIIAAIAFFSEGRCLEGLVALLFLIPCFARYYERRLKGTTQAYIHLVTLYRTGSLPKGGAGDAA